MMTFSFFSSDGARAMHIEILRTDGSVLHSGSAQTKKAFVQQLANEGKSFAGASLRNFDLKHLNLIGVDFTEADLTGAKMMGVQADRAQFCRATFDGVIAPGMSAKRAFFMGAVAGRDPESGEHASFAGAELTYSNFDGFASTEGDFSDAGVSSSTFAGAALHRCDFTDARLMNVDWTAAAVLGCRMRRALMTSSMKLPEHHLPDRTRDATILGNDLSGASLGAANRAFIRDRRLGRLTSSASYAAIAVAAFVAGVYNPMSNSDDVVRNLVGQGVGFIMAGAVVSLAGEIVGDGIKAWIGSGLKKAQTLVRSMSSRFAKSGKSMMSLSFAIVGGNARVALRDALRIRSEKGGSGAVLSAVAGNLHVVVCDRKRMASALSRLSDAIEGRPAPDRDVLIVRPGLNDPADPRAILLMSDGNVACLWDGPFGDGVSVEWNSDRKVVARRGYLRGIEEWGNARICSRLFMGAVFRDLGLEDPGFDLETHRVREGVDGSLVVLRRKDARLDNPSGPAVMTPDGQRLAYRNGREVEVEIPTEIDEPVGPRF